MKQTIGEIRTLLEKLEREVDASPPPAMQVFSGLELPDILRDIVDFLMPLLKPYEAAIYIHLLRHSIIETGNPHIRVSTYKLQTGVVQSAYAGSTSGGRNPSSTSGATFETVRKALRTLETVGAIRKEGDPNREGTLYRILLPEEIEACQNARKTLEELRPIPEVRRQDIDYYNVRENRLKVYERDQYQCQYCSKQLTRFTATLDHVKAIAEGGDNSFDNLVTACRECNSRKNSRLLGDFMAERS